MDDVIENLLNVILRELVKNVEAIKILKDDSAQDGLIVYRIMVDESDMGRIIGKQGRIAKSIRNIVRSAAIKNNIKVAVEIGWDGYCKLNNIKKLHVWFFRTCNKWFLGEIRLMSKNKYLCVGKIVGSRGIDGEIKIESWCDSPDVFFDIKKFFLDIESLPLNIENIRVHKSQVLMKIKDIKDKNSAEKLRGKLLYSLREDIPIDENSYFIEDLKNCDVVDAKSNKIYGKLKDVFNTGANDIYSVVNAVGKEYLVPIIENTVEKVDFDNEIIFINPIDGIFDL